jgi:hypothetical protein
MEAFLAGWPGQTHGTWLESRAARTWAPTTKATRCLLARLPRTPWATGYHPMILIRLFKTDFLVAWKVNNLFVFTRALTHYFLLESESLFLAHRAASWWVCLSGPIAIGTNTFISFDIMWLFALVAVLTTIYFLFFTLAVCKRRIFNAVSFAVMRACGGFLRLWWKIFVLINRYNNLDVRLWN